ncbi:MAG TPA: DUF748 domain-containing protein [Myxococcota bacterium]|nr:DUF748 domain-containing protein [Myxococcota bacterium]
MLLALVVAARLALPFVLHAYLERRLAHNPRYTGTIGAVDVAFYRGAYVIHDVDIRKRGARVPVPFLKAPLIDVSVEWRSIFQGKFVGEVVLKGPELNFVAGPTDAQRQSGNEGQWKKLVEALFPTRVNRFEVTDGKIHFRNFHSNPHVDVGLTHADLIAEDLSRSGDSRVKRPGHVEMRGEFEPTGHLALHVAVDPHASAPSFDGDLVVRGAELAQWNDFLRAYTKVDAKQGRFALYAELLAENGHFQGYVKPFFKDVQVIDWNDVAQLNLLSTAWRAFMQGVIEVFRNHAQDDVATRIPITGDQQPHGEFWPALGNALYNAFIEGLTPRLEHSVGKGSG